VDSTSLVWAGDGGVLDWQDEELNRMAGDDWKKREAMKMAAWIKPKMAHKKMVQSLLQVRAHLILCFRAEQKVEMTRDPETKKMIIQAKQSLTGLDGWLPVCDKALPFELTTSLLFTADAPGIPKPIKLQEQHRALFPLNQQVNEDSGRRIAEWAKGGTKKVPNMAPAECITVDQVIVLTDSLAEKGIVKERLLAAAGKALGHEVSTLAALPSEFYDKAKTWIERAAI
jgi:hypothetical protein